MVTCDIEKVTRSGRARSQFARVEKTAFWTDLGEAETMMTSKKISDRPICIFSEDKNFKINPKFVTSHMGRGGVSVAFGHLLVVGVLEVCVRSLCESCALVVSVGSVC